MLIIVVGSVGNSLVIAVVFKNSSQFTSTTNTFIVNLALADLSFLLFCVPFHAFILTNGNWIFGQCFCAIVHFFQYASMTASVWTLVAVSLDRFLAVAYPLQTKHLRKPKIALFCCVVIWLFSFVISSPTLFVFKVPIYEPKQLFRTKAKELNNTEMYNETLNEKKDFLWNSQNSNYIDEKNNSEFLNGLNAESKRIPENIKYISNSKASPKPSFLLFLQSPHSSTTLPPSLKHQKFSENIANNFSFFHKNFHNFEHFANHTFLYKENQKYSNGGSSRMEQPVLRAKRGSNKKYGASLYKLVKDECTNSSQLKWKYENKLMKSCKLDRLSTKNPITPKTLCFYVNPCRLCVDFLKNRKNKFSIENPWKLQVEKSFFNIKFVTTFKKTKNSIITQNTIYDESQLLRKICEISTKSNARHFDSAVENILKHIDIIRVNQKSVLVKATSPKNYQHENKAEKNRSFNEYLNDKARLINKRSVRKNSLVWSNHTNSTRPKNNIRHCVEKWVEYKATYYTFLFIIAYFIPLTNIAIFSTGTIQRLWSSSSLHCSVPSRSLMAKRRGSKLIIAVVLFFAICWLPAHVLWLAVAYVKVKKNYALVLYCVK